MRQRRSTQEHPPDLPPLMPPSPIDLEQPIDVPDEARMQVALHRALRYHCLRVFDAEGIDYAAYRGEMPIIVIGRRYPREVASGWWDIGHILDVHSGLTWDMAVHWEPETDRVRVGRIPPPPPPPPTPEPRPIIMDGNYRLHVQDGWRYWHEGREYTADEARAALQGRRERDGWTWERIEDSSS